jgi:hypothetical protein
VTTRGRGRRWRVTVVLLALAAMAAGSTTSAAAQWPQALSAGPPARLVLNIPATRLDVLRGDSLLHTYRVAVGARAFPTPIGEFHVTELTWNPWWVPPPSDWAKNETTQPPGPHNNMGRVKLRFGPTLFLHGSPYTSSIGRAASHGVSGCETQMRSISARRSPWRVRAGAALLDWLIRDTTATRRIQLACPLPLSVRYDVVEVRIHAEVHPDVYRRGVDVRLAALAALDARGYQAWEIDIARLDKFLRERKRAGDRITLSKLLKASDRAK